MAKTAPLSPTAPFVSVVMSVYNGSHFLKKAIESILSQTFKNFEFIIIDDGSTDATASIIRSYHDPRITVVSQSNHGLVQALNRGVELAQGTYIARQDADDISSSTRLEKQVAYLETHPDTIMVGSYYDELDASGRTKTARALPQSNNEIRLELYFSNPFAHGAVMLRKAAYEKAGGYRQDYWPAEDLDLWRRMAAVGHLHNLPEALYQFRYNEHGISLSNLDSQTKQVIRIHGELLADPRFLIKDRLFLATMKQQGHAAYAVARQRIMVLMKQAAKKAQISKCLLLSSMLLNQHRADR